MGGALSKTPHSKHRIVWAYLYLRAAFCYKLQRQMNRYNLIAKDPMVVWGVVVAERLNKEGWMCQRPDLVMNRMGEPF